MLSKKKIHQTHTMSLFFFSKYKLLVRAITTVLTMRERGKMEERRPEKEPCEKSHMICIMAINHHQSILICMFQIYIILHFKNKHF